MLQYLRSCKESWSDVENFKSKMLPAVVGDLCSAKVRLVDARLPLTLEHVSQPNIASLDDRPR